MLKNKCKIYTLEESKMHRFFLRVGSCSQACYSIDNTRQWLSKTTRTVLIIANAFCLLLSSQLVFASSNSSNFKIPGPYELPTGKIINKASEPPWIFNFTDQDLSRWSIDLRMHRVQPGSVCLEIAAKHLEDSSMGNRAQQSRPLQQQHQKISLSNRLGNTFRPGALVKPKDGDCKSPAQTKWPVFNIYVLTKRSGVSVDVDYDFTSSFGLKGFTWTLKDNNGKPIGGHNHPDFSRSYWAEDIAEATAFALYLRDEDAVTVTEEMVAVVDTTPETPAPRRPGNKYKGRQISKLDLSRYAAPEGPFGQQAHSLPTIKWKGNQSVNNLYLQAIDSLSRPREGYYCVRAVYQFPNADGFRVLQKNDDTWSVSPNEMTLSQLQRAPPRSCSPQPQLVFPIVLNQSDNTFNGENARLMIRGGNAAELPLSEARIDLVDMPTSRRIFASTRANRTWYKSPGKPFYAMLEGDNPVPDSLQVEFIVSKAGTEYYVEGQLPEKRKDEQGNYRFFHTLDPGQTSFEFQLEESANSNGSGDLLLCPDKTCDKNAKSISVDNYPIQIDLNTLPSLENPVLVVDIDAEQVVETPLADSTITLAELPEVLQTEPVDNIPASASANNLKSNLTIRPSISFGTYTRALTGCIAQLSDQSGSRLNAALSQGMQVFDRTTIPESAINTPEAWNVSFKSSRQGGDCPAEDLGSIPFSRLLSHASNSDEPLVIELKTAATLFAGFLHLGKKDYRESLLRWEETFIFFNKVYEHGRQNGQSWIDGVIFGPSAEKNEMRALVEPNSNFVTTFNGGHGIDDLTDDMVEHAKSLSDKLAFSEDRLLALGNSLGNTKISLLFFDDNATGCEDYEFELGNAGLNLTSTIVIAASNEYGAERFPVSETHKQLSGGLAALCYSTENLKVYTFNSYEVDGNRVWDKALNSIYEDIVSAGTGN